MSSYSSLSWLLLLLCVVGVSSLTVSDILTGNWQVINQAGIICDTTTCCCFNGQVNGYVKNGENYLNGTAAGVCSKLTQRDNMDTPSSYVWSAEFLGIDGAQFALTNLTSNSQLGISLTMNTSAVPAVSKRGCGFQIWKAAANGLPLTPDSPPSSSGTPTAMVSAYVQAFVGTWYADNTCATSSNQCCCLTNTVTISMSAAPSEFNIMGTPSAGCNVTSSTETDDFPWPMDAFTADNGYNVTFLPTADDYVVDYSAGTSNTIAFKDTTRSQCSFKIQSTPFVPAATTNPPTTTPTPTNTTATPTTPPKSQATHGASASAPYALAIAIIAVFSLS